MSAPIVLNRHDARFVKIAQISDLHFDERTRFPWNGGAIEPILDMLARDVVKQRPDVLCVTGDIADRGLVEAAKFEGRAFFDWFRTTKGRTYQEFLTQLWSDSKRFFLEHICRPAGIDPSALFVIPGNHDYRAQGIGGNDSTAIDIFRACFTAETQSRRLVFNSANGAPIDVRLVCIDSNLGANVEDLATGVVPFTELKKLAFLDEPSANSTVKEGVASFRVCLLHHHPLPVVTSESPQDLADRATVLGRIGKAGEMATGPQTTLLRNAGTFLAAAIAARVDLVLHGHDHHWWISEVRYPRADQQQRLIVAAAGSSTRETHGRFAYNVASLNRDASIAVVNHTLEGGSPAFTADPPFPQFPHGQLREIRWNKMCAAVRASGGGGDKQSAPHGSFKAEGVARVVEIRADGNALFTVSFDQLEPVSDVVKSYRMVTNIPGGYVATGRNVRATATASGNGRKYQIEPVHVVLDATTGQEAWEVQFTPELEPGHPASFEFQYLQCNAYEFDEQSRRLRAKSQLGHRTPAHLESLTSRFVRVFPKRMSDTVVFPEDLAPPGPPEVSVYDNESGRADAVETDYCEKRLQHVAGARLTSLSVDLPLPGLTYQIAWPLRPREEFLDEFFTDASVGHERRIAGSQSTPQIEAELLNRLQALKESFSHKLNAQQLRPLMGKATEIALYIARDESQDASAVEMVLAAAAILPGVGSPNDFPKKIPVGVGVGGQAFRSNRVLLDASGGSTGLYTMLAGQTRPHEFLCAVPLPAWLPGDAADERKRRVRAFGILCIGSYRRGSDLEQLLGRSVVDEVTRDAFIDFVRGRFSVDLLAYLTQEMV